MEKENGSIGIAPPERADVIAWQHTPFLLSMITINQKNIDAYLSGAAVFSCGGGLPIATARAMFGDCSVRMESLTAFAEGDVLMSVYGIGSVADTKKEIDFSALASRALTRLAEVVGAPCAGLIPGEIGGETSAFVVGATRNIPVVDGDLVGGRAAPEVTMDCFTLFALPVGPVVFSLANGKDIVCDERLSGAEVERTVRAVLTQEQSPGALAGYAVRAKQLSGTLAEGTMSEALRVGAALITGGALLDIRPDARIVAEGIVVNTQLEDAGGFFFGRVTLSDGAMLVIKNELLGVLRDARLVESAPTILTLCTHGNPVHTTDIVAGMEVTIYAFAPHQIWQASTAQSVLGPAYVTSLIKEALV